MKKTQDKIAASVTVYKVADMTDKRRKEVCDWLRKLARDIKREPETFAKTFRARFFTANDTLHGSPEAQRKEIP